MKTLVLIDLINDMVAESGKLSGKGYLDHAIRRGVPEAVQEWRARSDVDNVIHVGLEFRQGFTDAPKHSILLGQVQKFGVAEVGSDGCQFVTWAQPEASDFVLRKRRMSPFMATELEFLLRALGTETVLIGGVATDLAVNSAARDAHDRDFKVGVVEGLCIAATDAEHDAAIENMRKFATIF